MLVHFTDTNTDITAEMARELGYKLISMPLSFDNQTYYPHAPGCDLDIRSYYDRLRGGLLPTTSGLNKEEYLAYFEPEFAAGNDIFYVHFSSGMSSTFQNMNAAAEELLTRYPGRKFYALDTLGISALAINILLEVSDLFRSGKTPEEVLRWSQEELNRFACYFFADNLSFFKRSGRCGGITAAMGTLLGVRPIIFMNAEGKMVNIGKERGREKALCRLLSYMEELGDHLKDHRIIISHADAGELAEDLSQRILKQFGPDLHVTVLMLSPTSGAHCGPDTMGVSFHAVHK